MAWSPCSKKFILIDSFLTRWKTEYIQNSRSYRAPLLASSTTLLSVLLPLALVKVSCTLLGASWAGGNVPAASSGPVSIGISPTLFWKKSSSLDVQKKCICRYTKYSRLPSSKASSETFDRSNSAMQSLCASMGLIRERWYCTWGYSKIAVPT